VLLAERLKMDEKELIRFIRRAAREGWTELYLSNKGLTSIPAEIGKLTNLTSLYLDPKQASSLRLPRSGADDFTGT